MNLLNQIQHNLKTIKFRAEQQIRIRQMRIEIKELRKQIVDLHKKIAIATIDLFQRGELANKELSKLCLSVEEVSRMISEKETAILTIRAEIPQPYSGVSSYIRCPHCNWYQNLPNDVYCRQCGRLIRISSDDITQRSCPKGHFLLPGTKYCTECGWEIVEQPDLSIQEESS